MNRDSMFDPILGFQNYREFNHRSCLKRVPLGRLQNFYSLFKAKSLEPEQMVVSATIAFRLHKEEIGDSINEILRTRLDSINQKAQHPLTLAEYEAIISPENWCLTPGGITRDKLF